MHIFRNKAVQALVSAAALGILSSAGWLFAQTSGNTATLATHEQKLRNHESQIIELHKDVREIRDWTRSRR